MKRTVLNMLQQATEHFPDHGYVNEKTEQGWVSYTYKEVYTLSEAFACGLIDYGFQKGDRLAILSEGRGSWVVGEYGILKAGCIAVPLSVNLLAEEILFRLQHSEAKAALVSKNTINKLVKIWAKIGTDNFCIICLDNLEEINKTGPLSQNNFQSERILLSFDQIMNQGRRILHKDPEMLRQRSESIDETDVVTISYTSGTTGNPKGIMLTHLNYWSNSRDALEYFRLPMYWKTLIILPLDHSFAHTIGIYISLLCGLSIYFLDARHGPLQALRNIPENLREVKPDLLLTVPALTRNFMKRVSDNVASRGSWVKKIFDLGLQAGIRVKGNGYRKPPWLVRLVNFPVYKLADILIFQKVREVFGGNLKFCVGGGAYLDLGQQEFFYALNVPIYQGYGLTEASPIISTNCWHTHKLGTSGRIINNLRCSIFNTNGSKVAEGNKGQIAVRGNNVMKGYYKNPVATQESIREGWLLTGDLGYFDQDGFLVVSGRLKALLISADGEKYSPESIEEAIISSSKFIYQVMAYNDHRRYTTALITLDQRKVKEYSQKHDIKDPEKMLTIIKNSFYAFQKQRPYAGLFPSKWIPSVFRIIEEPFTEKNKMINSTMKMVRHRIEQNYSQVIESMYSSPGNAIYCTQNIKAINNILKSGRIAEGKAQ